MNEAILFPVELAACILSLSHVVDLIPWKETEQYYLFNTLSLWNKQKAQS